MRLLAYSVVAILFGPGCGGGPNVCNTVKCDDGSNHGNSNTYQLCASLTGGGATYKYNGKSCTCPTANSAQCQDCSVAIGAYCGLTGTDGGVVYQDSTDLSVAPCSITLSGAVTGTFACLATTVYANGSMLGGPTLTVMSPSPLEGLEVTITRPSMPTDGTWSSTDPGAKGALTVSQPGVPPPTWIASVGGSQDQGSYTMNIRLGGTAQVSSGDQYIANGTIMGTLVPVPMTGSSGTVTLQASF